MNKSSNRFGFSLIELIVVSGIMITLLGVTLVYYNRFTDEKKLEAESIRLTEVLRVASKKATAGDLSKICIGSFLGYRVTINTNDFTLALRCTSSNNVVNSYRFGSQVKADTTTAIDFKPISSSPVGTPTSCIRLSSSAVTSKCRCIDVDSGGAVHESACATCTSCP